MTLIWLDHKNPDDGRLTRPGNARLHAKRRLVDDVTGEMLGSTTYIKSGEGGYYWRVYTTALDALGMVKTITQARARLVRHNERIAT